MTGNSATADFLHFTVALYIFKKVAIPDGLTIVFNTFYIDGQSETVTPIRRQRFVMNQKQISRLFAYLHEIFDEGYPPYTITDGPTWHLAIANQQGQIYQYEGMMVQDEWLLGLNGVLHECIDRIDGLWDVKC